MTIQAQTDRYNANGEQISLGLVRIQYGDRFLLTADKCVTHTVNKTFHATGNVKMDLKTQEGLVEIAAQELFFDYGRESGYFLDVAATFGDELYFVGKQLEILQGGDLILIEEGRLTACNQPLPQWSMKIRQATIQQEGYAVVRGAKFLIKGVPFLYFPYAILPAMQERRSGLLQPDTGRSTRNGDFLNLPLYWAPRQDMDMTFIPSYFDKAGFRLDLEGRYHPRETLLGNIQGAFFRDKVIQAAGPAVPIEDKKPIDADRFRVTWDHDQTLGRGHLKLEVEDGSDFSVDRDFLQDAEKTRLRDYFDRLRYDRPQGYSHFSLEADRLQRIMVNEDEVIGVTQLPSLRFHQLQRPLWGGFYYRSQTFVDRFDLNDVGPAKLNETLLRYGVEAEVSRPLNLGRWFHARWGADLRTADYDRSPDIDQAQTQLQDGNVTRAYGFFEVVGPKFRKTFGPEDRRRFHDLELGIDVRYGNEDEDPFLEQVRLDELDLRLFQPGKGLVTAWRLNSRVFQTLGGTFRPMMELEIRQEIRANHPDGSDNGPIETRLRLVDLSGFYANGVVEYDPDEGTFETLTLYGSVNRGHWRGYGGYVKRRSDPLDDNETFIGISDFQLPKWRSRIRVAVDYDVVVGDVKSQEILYGYQGQCLGFALNYVRSPFDSSRRNQNNYFQFTLSLKNLSELGTKF